MESTTENTSEGIPLQALVQQPPRHRRTHTGDSTPSYEPQRQPIHQISSMHINADTVEVPERKVTLFALHVAVLEKAASHIGAVCFIWATVVLLGGFVAGLETKDFWFVTVILLIEGTRIFSRSNELELQEQPMLLPAEVIPGGERMQFDATSSSTRPPRVLYRNTLDDERESEAYNSSAIHLLPVGGWVFEARNISNILYWLQLLSASACVTLSLMRLTELRFTADVQSSSANTNTYYALQIFYILALTEAVIFLVERAYWEWVFNHHKLIEKVSGECNLGEPGKVPIKRFFYRAYSKSIEGSILDGMKMDLVSFAAELMSSDSHDEQLVGVHILRSFMANDEFAARTLRKIGTSAPTIERLIEMLNWKSPNKHRIRKSAAEIVLKLAGKRQNVLRVATIPGAIEAISSLLETGNTSGDADQRSNSLPFNEMGLHIIKKLARDPGNSAKICNSRGLLSRIVYFTRTMNSVLKNAEENNLHIKTVLRSLQVVKNLTSTTGHTGKVIRQEISDNVFIVGNIRKVLQHGENHTKMQLTAIGILADLAIDEEAKEKIGSTGGVIPQLLSMFISPASADAQISIRLQAGEVLALLALESERNCERILREEVVQMLVSTLQHAGLQINSSRVLLNLCTYSKTGDLLQLTRLTAAIPMVFKAIMVEKKKLLEVSLGLATQIIKRATLEGYVEIFGKAGITDADIARKLVDILKEHRTPKVKVPRMRRFIIELAITMMKSNVELIPLFKNLELEKELKSIAKSTSELESFNMFSGSIGLSRHSSTLSFLVDDAMDIMHSLQNAQN